MMIIKVKDTYYQEMLEHAIKNGESDSIPFVKTLDGEDYILTEVRIRKVSKKEFDTWN